MRRSEWHRQLMRLVVGAILLAAACSARAVTPSPAVSAKTPGLPDARCDDLNGSFGGVPSTGWLKVPVTVEQGNPFRDPDALKAINILFKPAQVEGAVLDARLDLPSRARLLEEYRCFGTWRRQQDFYRKVARQSDCAYLRHKAIGLLEYDMCNTDTVSALLDEYHKSSYAQTRELIVRCLGLSRDARAKALLKQVAESGDNTLSRAAAEARSLAQSQSCSSRPDDSKPNYGSPDVMEACEDGPPVAAPAPASPSGSKSGASWSITPVSNPDNPRPATSSEEQVKFH